MRIVRYTLPVLGYQQLQPLWPGRVLSVTPGQLGGSPEHADYEAASMAQTIDMWCTAGPGRAHDHGAAPVLGVWMVGTKPLPSKVSEPLPDALADNFTNYFHGTCVMDTGHAWHIFTTVEGVAEPAQAPLGEVSSVCDIIDKIKTRHAHRAPRTEGTPQ